MTILLKGLVVATTLLALIACSSTPEQVEPTPAPPPDAFPKPAGLEPQVDFWRNVYGVWSRSQMVFHDNKYMDLIYEVATLPGPIEEGYTNNQRDFVNYRKKVWKNRLKELERKSMTGIPLTPPEKELAQEIVSKAGTVYGVSERLHGQRGLRERFKRGLEISGRYDKIFRNIFRQAGLPEDLAYLPHVESSFQNHAHSSAGAVGMWQFMKPAARTYMNYNQALDERRDPVASARGASRYLRDAYDQLGYWPLALTSYNHGIGGMKRAKKYHGNDFMDIVYNYEHRYFGFASRNFYAEFLAAREVASNPQRYFPEGINYQPPLNWDQVVLRLPTRASEVARQYRVNKGALIAMNKAWTKAAEQDRVALPAGTMVWLPPGTLMSTTNAIGNTFRVADKARNTPATGTPGG